MPELGERVEDFLRLRMVADRDPKVKKVTVRLEEQVRCEIIGFNRAQNAFRHILKESAAPRIASLGDIRPELPKETEARV